MPAVRRSFVIPLLLALAVLAAYAPALRAGFIWDDDDYVTANPTLPDPHGLRRIWTEPTATPQYYPLVHTSFWIEYRLWGLDPRGYHAVNILLHAANAGLLYLALTALGIPGAALAAGLFALHPVGVESVAWITERKNTLSAFFYLLSLLCWIRFAGLARIVQTSAASAWRSSADSFPPGSSGRSWRAYAGAFLFFLAALLSKTVTASLPAVFLLLAWWRRGRVGWRDLPPLIPFLAAGLAFGRWTAFWERHVVGAGEAAFSLAPAERILVAGRAVWFYLGKLLWPHPLLFIYPRWQLHPQAIFSWLPPLAAIVVLLLLFAARGRIGRGPFAAAGFFILTLFPALGFFDVYPMRYSFVADHFQYLATIGPLTLAAALIHRALRARIFHTSSAAAALLLLLPLFLGMLTFRQAGIYHDREKLWRATLTGNPDSWMARFNLGKELLATRRNEEAAAEFTRSVTLRPDFREGWNALGLSQAGEGRWPDAAAAFSRALAVAPDWASAHANLAWALQRMGRNEEALDHARRAVWGEPGQVAWRVLLADLLSRLQRYDEALATAAESRRRFPTSADAANSLGVVLARQGKLGEARFEFQRALTLDPGCAEARRNLRTAEMEP